MAFVILKQIGISVVFNSENLGNIELAFIYLQDVEFAFLEQKDSRTFQARD